MALEDKLYHTRFVVDVLPHIKVSNEICLDCLEKPCLYVCPSGNYKLEDNRLNFAWEGCLECGACRVVCGKGAVDWSYPRGGFGVSLRYG